MPDTDALSLTLPKVLARVKRKRRKIKPPSKIWVFFFCWSVALCVDDWITGAWISATAMGLLAIVSWLRILRSMGQHRGPIIDYDPRFRVAWPLFLFAIIAMSFLTGK